MASQARLVQWREEARSTMTACAPRPARKTRVFQLDRPTSGAATLRHGTSSIEAGGGSGGLGAFLQNFPDRSHIGKFFKIGSKAPLAPLAPPKRCEPPASIYELLRGWIEIFRGRSCPAEQLHKLKR